MKTIAFLLTILAVSFSYGQSAFWGRTTESAFTNEAMGIATDNAGNSYVAGYITGETAFDINLNFPTAQGNGDIYVAKYSINGNLIWVKKFGGSFSDRAYAITLDNSGNVIVVGQYSGTVEFGNTTVSSVSNSRDIFILKLSSSGDVIWAKSEGGSGAENVYDVTADNNNNIFITGQFQGSTSIAGQTFTSMVDPANNQPSYDMFISKYNSSGNPLWVKVGSAKYEERGLGIATDELGNVYLSAQFSDTLTISGQTINNNAYNVALIIKFDANGTVVWTNTLQSSMVMAYGIEVKNNNIYITGDSGKNLKYSNNNDAILNSTIYPKSIFVLKTNLDGKHVWMSRIGSYNHLSARALTVDSSDRIYVTGYFSCSISELHEPQTAYFNSVGHRDTYLWKINSNGTYDYLKNFGGKYDDYGRGIATLPNNGVIICGSFVENLFFPTNNQSVYDVSNQYDNYFTLNSSGINEYLYLAGDASANSFLTTAMNNYSKKYNYFAGQPTDSLEMYVLPMADTNYVCVSGSANAVTNANPAIGPNYDFLWNTNQTLSSTSVNSTGWYSCTVQREDGCSGIGTDSTYIVINPKPSLPLMFDSLELTEGIAFNPSTGYYEYLFCHPDSVEIWFEDLAPNTTISISNADTSHYDSLPHYYDYNGETNVLITDTITGCTANGYFNIEYDYEYPYEYDPYLFFSTTNSHFLPFQDTLEVCEDGYLIVDNYDYFNNPDSIFELFPDDYYMTIEWTTEYQGEIIHSAFYTPDSFDNWEEGYRYETPIVAHGNLEYIVKFNVLIGYDNTCGVDTTRYIIEDTIQIISYPLPEIESVTIMGDNMLCPNGSVYLYIDNPQEDVDWIGPGIQWTSPNGDSVQVTSPGTFEYSWTVIDPVTGCSICSPSVFYLGEKEIPSIMSTSPDGIVCPYDSVYMYVNDDYVSYEWHGPDGQVVGDDEFYHWDEVMGFYYVTVVDDEECSMTTLPYELKEYSTPYLSVFPYNTICEGETVTIETNVFGEGHVNWIYPSNYSTELSIEVDEPGWYICEITQCGITVIDSLEIIDKTINVTISSSDTIICYGETIDIFADSDPGYYEWSNGAEGVGQITVATSGEYWVSVENEFGCSGISNSIFINYIENSIPPEFEDIATCEEGMFTITANETLSWYDNDSTFISTGNSLTIDLQSDTTILISYEATEFCPLAYTTVSIELLPQPIDAEILGDTDLCVGEDLLVFTGDNTMDFKWYFNDEDLDMENTDTIVIAYDDLAQDDNITLEIYNQCGSTFSHRQINLLPQYQSGITEDSLLVCKNTDVIITTEESFENTMWFGVGGVVESDTLIFNSDYPQYVYVTQEDENGCYTIPDSIWIDMPDFYIEIFASATMSCVGDTVFLTYQTDLDSVVVWNTPQGTTEGDTLFLALSIATEGWYYVGTYDSLGCYYSDSVELFANLYPNDYSLPNDTIVCLDDYISLLNYGDYEVLWNGESMDSIQINDDSWYVVTIIDQNTGCSIEDSIYVETVNCNNELPNVVTPNGDGVNDYFVIDEAIILPNNYLVIFNRWGNVVFEEHGYRNTFGADGLNDGVYFYRFYKDYKNQPRKSIEGFLHVLR